MYAVRSRRDFLAVAILLVLGLLAVACAQPTAAPQVAEPTKAPASAAPAATAVPPTPAAQSTTATGGAQSGTTFKFGAILNLTGPTAAQGLQFRQGIELAADLWNKQKGGIDGIPIQLIFEDHAGQPAQAVTAARKLIDVDKVQVFANVYSSPALAVVPIADQAKVLQVSAGSNSPRLINASKYFISGIVNATFDAKVGISYIQKALGAKSLALIYRNDDFGNGTKDFIVPYWESLGGKWVIVEGHEPTQTEFATLAAKVAAAKPEVVYIASSAANQGLLVKQLRESGVNVPLISYQGLEVPELFSVAGKAAENAFWTAPALTEDKALDQKFIDDFRAKYGKDPDTIYYRTHFDLANTVFEAATEVKKKGLELNGTNIRDAMLNHGPFTGVLGSVTYLPDGNCIRALDLKTAKDGKPAVFLTARQLQEKGIFDFGLK